MNELLTDWGNYIQDVNCSLAEREQIISSMEILQEKVEELYKCIPEDGNRKPAFRVQGLMEVVLMALKSNYETDIDTLEGFERLCWKAKGKMKNS